MYKNLISYRNELKNNFVSRYKLLGIVVELILSKEIFKKNIDLKKFLKDVLEIELKDYVLKSRTLIAAHCCRFLEKKEEKELSIIKKNIYSFIVEEIENLKASENIKNEKNDFNGWLK